MDRLESLGNTLSQITLYDIKSMYNQAKNVVLNVSEMEAKVREATNDDPWGASSTLMQEIAQGTFNFQQFNEIMPSIYARFMEKEARQWRQIYKSLQLLEYLVKNGSERVVDDARSHIGTIKMLRNFYYIDEKGKDQGINVRNRSKEIIELLSDVDTIRNERRKAKTNKTKYTGTGNDGGWGMSSSGSRYGGFGSDSVGGGSYGGSYDPDAEGNYSGGGSYSGGGGGSSGGAFRDDNGRRGYQEYDAGDDETPRRSNSISHSARSPESTTQRSATLPTTSQSTTKAKEQVKEVDLLGFGDDGLFTSSVSTAQPAASGVPTLASPSAVVAPASTSAPVLDDDDFDDFQAAPASAPALNQVFTSLPTQAVAPTPPIQPQIQSFVQPQQAPMQPNLFGNVGVLSPTSPRANSTFASPVTPNYGFSNVNTGSSILTPTSSQPRSNVTSPGLVKPSPAASAKSSGGNFDDLWNMSLGSKPTATTTSGPAKSMKDLEKEKASAGIWGASMQQQGKPPAMGMGLGSNSLGGFGSAAPPKSASGGVDDLLF